MNMYFLQCISPVRRLLSLLIQRNTAFNRITAKTESELKCARILLLYQYCHYFTEIKNMYKCSYELLK